MTPPRRKRCPSCGETKPVKAFYRAARRRDGRQPYCIACDQAYQRRRYAALTPEQREDRQRLFRELYYPRYRRRMQERKAPKERT